MNDRKRNHPGRARELEGLAPGLSVPPAPAPAGRARCPAQPMLDASRESATRVVSRESATRDPAPGEPHRRRLLDLVGLDLPEPEARRHLRRIEGNRDELSRALGREVSLAVAALDHFTRAPSGSEVGSLRSSGSPGSPPLAPDLRVVDRSTLDRLAGLARTDALTGLLNRRGLEPVLEGAFALAQRTGTSLSLLALDLDGFKGVNDRHGHPWGDLVLSRVSALLAAHCRASDALARVGGDELVVVLPDTDAAGARVLADRLREAVASSDLLAGCTTRAPGERVTVSVGAATGARSARELLEGADRALYRAKQAGRNRSAA